MIKKDKKIGPFSVRFNDSDYDFLVKNEGNATPQEVVYFLFKEYRKSKSPNIQVAQQQIPIEPKKTTVEPERQLKLKRTPAQWVQLRRDCESAKEYEKWLSELENDTFLAEKEKQLIKQTL
jgi:hypothetical protein